MKIFFLGGGLSLLLSLWAYQKWQGRSEIALQASPQVSPKISLQVSPQASKRMGILGTKWFLIRFPGVDVDAYGEVTLEFGESRFSGKGWCNGYSGSYELKGRKLKMSDMGGTAAGCGNILQKYDSLFFDSLFKVVSFNLANDELELLYRNKKGDLKSMYFIDRNEIMDKK